MEIEIIGTDNKSNDLLKQILQHAGDSVGFDGTAEKAAIATQAALAIAERERVSLSAIQAMIVTWVAKTHVWRDHPQHYASLRDWIKDADLGTMSASTISHLASLGEMIVPFAEANGVDITPAVSPENWSKTKAAMSKLRRAVKDSDAQEFQSVIRTVEMSESRKQIRDTYAEKRNGKAPGSVVSMNGDSFLVIHCTSEGVEKLTRELGEKVEWGELALEIKQQKHKYEVAIWKP